MKNRNNRILALGLISALAFTPLAGCSQQQATQSTSTESTDAENTNAESTDAENTNAESTDAEKATEDISEQANLKRADLTKEEKDSLMKQIAEKELEKQYKDYIPDEVFSNVEFFEVDKDGKKVKAYGYLTAEEYVDVNGKAYNTSGTSGPVVIYYEETDDGVKLEKVERCVDGDGYDEWLRDNFSTEARKLLNAFLSEDDSIDKKLRTEIKKEAEDKLGVSVDTEYDLIIDLDKGTYEIYKSIESGDTPEDYTFETETIESGKLTDLKK